MMHSPIAHAVKRPRNVDGADVGAARRTPTLRRLESAGSVRRWEVFDEDDAQNDARAPGRRGLGSRL